MDSKESQWIRIKERDLKGIIHPSLKPILTARFFEDLGHQVVDRGGWVLKDSRIRWAGIFPLEGGKALYVKEFRVAGWWQRIRYLLGPSQAMKEWRVSRFLLEKGILTPQPLGVIERRRHGVLRECYFVTEALEGARDLLQFCKNRFHDSDKTVERNQILKIVAEKVQKIHEIRLFHRDLHAGNFLIRPPNGGPLSLYLVDLHQARKRLWVSRTNRLWNIAQIFNSLDFMLDREAKVLLLRIYARGGLTQAAPEKQGQEMSQGEHLF
jgi:serine/threonine protein kinase